MLAVALIWMNMITVCGDVLLDGLHVHLSLFTVFEYPPHIIHKASIMEPIAIDLQMVKVIQVIVLRYLPVLVSQAGATVEVPVEDNAFVGRNIFLPHPSRRSQVGMQRGVTPCRAQQDI